MVSTVDMQYNVVSRLRPEMADAGMSKLRSARSRLRPLVVCVGVASNLMRSVMMESILRCPLHMDIAMRPLGASDRMKPAKRLDCSPARSDSV